MPFNTENVMATLPTLPVVSSRRSHRGTLTCLRFCVVLLESAMWLGGVLLTAQTTPAGPVYTGRLSPDLVFTVANIVVQPFTKRHRGI